MVPLNATTVPPNVVIEPPPLTPEIVGCEYAVVATDAADATPSTSRIQTYPAPTPATVVQVIWVGDCVVEHPVAFLYVTHPSLL